MLGVSEVASRIVQSTIRTMSVECEKVGGVNLAQGVCDTEVPAVVRQAAERAIEAGYNQYTRADGIASLREAIAKEHRLLEPVLNHADLVIDSLAEISLDKLIEKTNHFQ